MDRTDAAVPEEIAGLGRRYRLAAGQAALEILGEGRTGEKAEEVASISAEYADREVRAWRIHPAAPGPLACRPGACPAAMPRSPRQSPRWPGSRP